MKPTYMLHDKSQALHYKQYFYYTMALAIELLENMFSCYDHLFIGSGGSVDVRLLIKSGFNICMDLR